MSRKRRSNATELSNSFIGRYEQLPKCSKILDTDNVSQRQLVQEINYEYEVSKTEDALEKLSLSTNNNQGLTNALSFNRSTTETESSRRMKHIRQRTPAKSSSLVKELSRTSLLNVSAARILGALQFCTKTDRKTSAIFTRLQFVNNIAYLKIYLSRAFNRQIFQKLLFSSLSNIGASYYQSACRPVQKSGDYAVICTSPASKIVHNEHNVKSGNENMPIVKATKLDHVVIIDDEDDDQSTNSSISSSFCLMSCMSSKSVRLRAPSLVVDSTNQTKESVEDGVGTSQSTHRETVIAKSVEEGVGTRQSTHRESVIAKLQLRWGGKNMINSCPWDGILVSLAAHFANTPEHIIHIVHEPNDITNAIQKFLNRVIFDQMTINEAKEKLVKDLAVPLKLNEISDSTYDLYGNDYQPLIEPLEYLTAIRCKARCSKAETCSNPETTRDFQGFSLKYTNDMDVKEEILRLFRNRRRNKQCGQPFDGKPNIDESAYSEQNNKNGTAYFCNGTIVKIGEPIFVNPHPILFSIGIDRMPATEWRKLPEEITILGVKYYLGSCNISAPGHFTCLVKIVDQWYYYDGMASPLFDRVDEGSDQLSHSFQNIKITHAMFFMK